MGLAGVGAAVSGTADVFLAGSGKRHLVGVVVGGAPVVVDVFLPEAGHSDAWTSDDHACTSVRVCM